MIRMVMNIVFGVEELRFATQPNLFVHFHTRYIYGLVSNEQLEPIYGQARPCLIIIRQPGQPNKYHLIKLSISLKSVINFCLWPARGFSTL